MKIIKFLRKINVKNKKWLKIVNNKIKNRKYSGIKLQEDYFNTQNNNSFDLQSIVDKDGLII